MIDRVGQGRLILAGLAGTAVLAFVGAPQAVEMLTVVGPDKPGLAGTQLAVAAAGAIATAVAILLSRRWPVLLATGAVGVLAGLLIQDPAGLLFNARVFLPDDPGTPQAPVPAGVGMLLMAAAGLLLVGLFGVARELLRTGRVGASLAGLVGAAGYFGVAVIGPLATAGTAARLGVAGLAAALTVVAAIRSPAVAPAVSERGWRIRYVAAGVVLVSVLPTLVVALSGDVLFGTVTGGVTGLVVLAAAVGASAPAGRDAMLAVGATGLVLAAPVVTLLLIRDGVAGEVWYAWPIALAGVLTGAAVAARRWPAAGVVAVAAVPMLLLGLGFADVDEPAGETIVWVFLYLSMAAVAATVGTAATRFGGAVPAFGALATVAGVGAHGALSLFRIGPGGTADLEKTVGPTGYVIGAVLLATAAALLLVPRERSRTAAEPVDRTARPR